MTMQAERLTPAPQWTRVAEQETDKPVQWLADSIRKGIGGIMGPTKVNMVTSQQQMSAPTLLSCWRQPHKLHSHGPIWCARGTFCGKTRLPASCVLLQAMHHYSQLWPCHVRDDCF
jgi:hypothetical protein